MHMDMHTEKIAGPFKIVGGTLGEGYMWVRGKQFTKSGENEIVFPYYVYKESSVVHEYVYKRYKRYVGKPANERLMDTPFGLFLAAITVVGLVSFFSDFVNSIEVTQVKIVFEDTNEAIVEYESAPQ